MQPFNPAIEWRDPKTLIPYDNNAKAHPPDQVKKIAEALKSGFDQPIVIDESNTILKGHGRREASLLLRLPQVPVIVRQGLSEEQKRAIRLSDNKSAESDWLYGALAIEFEALDLAGLDVELATGFNQTEIDDILAANQEVEADAADTASSKKRIQKKSGTIKVVLAADQVAIIEQALRQTGIANRGEAFTKVCQVYLNGQNSPEGQFNFLAEDPFTALGSESN